MSKMNKLITIILISVFVLGCGGSLKKKTPTKKPVFEYGLESWTCKSRMLRKSGKIETVGINFFLKKPANIRIKNYQNNEAGQDHK